MTAPELRDLLARCTKGPWQFDQYNDGRVFRSCYGLLSAEGNTLGVHVESEHDQDWGLAMANLVALAPTLAAELIDARAERDALREALREVRITAAVHDNWQLAAPRIFAIVESALKENRDE